MASLHRRWSDRRTCCTGLAGWLLLMTSRSRDESYVLGGNGSLDRAERGEPFLPGRGLIRKSAARVEEV